MRARVAFAMTSALAALLTACPARTPVLDPTAAPTASGSVAPSVEPTPSVRRLPVASLAAYVSNEGLHLYDVKTDALRLLLRGTGIRQPRFLNRNTIAFLRDEGAGTTVVAFGIRDGALTTLLTSESRIDVWSPRPDNEEIAYVATDATRYPQIRYHALVGNRTTMVVTTLARAFGREAHLDDQQRISWSPDGARAAVVYTPADGDEDPDPAPVPDTASQLQVRRSDGALEFAAPHAQEPTEAVLSADGRKLYFRSDAGTRVWDASTGRTAGVPGRPPRWFNPAASLDGRTIAYDTGATTLQVRTEVLDVRTGTRTRVGPAGRANPIYANLRTVWTQGVRRCDDCLYPVVPAPEVFAVDLRNGKEKKLRLPTLEDLAVFYA